MLNNLKPNLTQFIINSLMINLLLFKVSYCLKCYTCQSSNVNRDLDCHVEQGKQTQKLLKQCNANQTTCLHLNYDGIDPITGEKFFNIVRECSNETEAHCTRKKKKNLSAFICFCQGDGCNMSGIEQHKPNSILYLFIFICTVLFMNPMKSI